MAAPATRRDPAAFRAHALALAERRHTLGTARWQGDPFKTTTVRVPSRSGRGEYTVRAVTADHWTCSCPAVGACAHIGAALAAFEQRERALAAEERDEFEVERRLAIYGW